MQAVRNRWLFRLAVLGAVALMALWWAAREGSQSRLAVTNRSGQRIDQLRITLGGEKRVFKDVRAGAEESATFGRGSEDRFTVEGRLADGTMIRGSGRAPGQANLIVMPGGQIVFRQDGKTAPF